MLAHHLIYTAENTVIDIISLTPKSLALDSIDQGQCDVNKAPEKRQEATDKGTLYILHPESSVNLETLQKSQQICSCLLKITKYDLIIH